METFCEDNDLIKKLQELDTNNLDIWSYIVENNPKKIAQSVQFYDNILTIIFTNENNLGIELKPYFANINNIFNDELLTNEYKSLSNTIVKLDLLDMRKTKNIILKWIECLQTINFCLQNKKKEIDDINSNYIIKKFLPNYDKKFPENEENSLTIQFQKNEGAYIEDLSFSVVYSSKSKNNLETLLNIISQNFILRQIPKKSAPKK